MEKCKSTKKGLAKKIALVLLAVVLIVGATIAGTLAWLTATTDDVVNTFVVGDIGTLTLTETTTGTGEDGEYIIVPGDNIEKDPKVSYVSVTAGEGVVPVDVYVFVKIEAAGWTRSDDTLTYSITGATSGAQVSWSVDKDIWTPVYNVPGVYYKALAAGTDLTDASVITGNKIEVSSNIVHDDVDDIAAAADKIIFTAYAIQQSGAEGTAINADDAWKALNP